jgi:hypothetical protein
MKQTEFKLKSNRTPNELQITNFFAALNSMHLGYRNIKASTLVTIVKNKIPCHVIKLIIS